MKTNAKANESNRSDFSVGSIPGTILRLSGPLILAQLINALYNIVDRIFIGRIPEVGSLALTGLGVCFPFIMIVSAFAQLAGMGGAPLASIARGEGDDRGAERILGNSFTLSLLFGAVLTVSMLLIKDKALYWVGASGDTFAYANEYLTIYLIGSPFVMISLGINAFISVQGFARVSMMTVLVGAVVNIVLDPILIFVFGMGVRGAALATVISQALSAVWVLRFLTGKRCVLPLKKAAMRPDGKVIRRVLSLGLSTFVMSVNDSLVSIACNSSLQLHGGDLYVGVMTVVSSVRQVLTMPLHGFSQAAMPVLGYNYGAKRYRRVREAALFTLYVSLGFSAVVQAVAMLAPATLFRLFTDDAALIAAGAPLTRIYFAMFVFMGFQMMGQRCFVSMGRAKKAIFFSLLRKAFIVAPLTLLLPYVGGLGVEGVFWAEPVSDFVGPVACFTTFMVTEWGKLREEPV
ncbi:MAG: MATE family efflux transporter [Oscillospiraceae bacterium]|jgi:putative MATE family efflux protein|nr:MATE family efflux transporter [Oscillospiraceae bacterium]